MVHNNYGSFASPYEQNNALVEQQISISVNMQRDMNSTQKTPNDSNAIKTHNVASGEVTVENAISGADNAPIVEDDERSPNDNYSLVYLIFLLHGIGVLLPWNTFLTISNDYFLHYKLIEANATNYYANFFGYLGACSQIPNLLCNLVNLFIIVHGAGLVRRIFAALSIIIIICIFTIVLIPINSQSWPFPFFMMTMLSVVLLNSANGIYQNSIFGLASDFPWRFINAVILGSNTCGTFISILAILTSLFSSNTQLATLLYFGISFITVIACLISFASLPKLKFYRYYIAKAERTRNEKRKTENLLLDDGVAQGSNDTGSTEEQQVEVLDVEPKVSLATYIAIFKESWRHMLDVFLVFFVTLAIFPTVLVKIYPHKNPYYLPFSENMFGSVFVFLNFNAFALLGNVIANYIQWPSPKYLSAIVLPRLFFIPAFWLCNYIPFGEKRQLLPVLVQNDWVVVILISLMAISHGYCSSLAMMYAPKVVHGSKSQLAGMMSAFLLVFGITTGVLFTFVEVAIFS